MKQIVIDFSATGFVNGIKHFLKGVVLYAAIGALGYITTRYTGWHPGTLPEIGIYTLIGEGLQALSKWLTTAQVANDTQDIVVDPATLG